jgi:hypothetical protein
MLNWAWPKVNSEVGQFKPTARPTCQRPGCRVYAPPGATAITAQPITAGGRSVCTRPCHGTHSPPAINGPRPRQQIPLSPLPSPKTELHRHHHSPPVSYHSSSLLVDSFCVDHRLDSPVLLPLVSQLKLASSSLHTVSRHQVPSTDDELSPLCLSSLAKSSIELIMSSCSSWS